MLEEPVFDAVACIQEAKNGNLKALDPVLETMYGRLGMFLHPLVPSKFRNKLLDCDLLQEALLVALQKFDNFCGDTKEDLFSWIAAIIRNISTDAIRNLLAAKRDCRREMSLEQRIFAPKLLDQRNFGPDEEAIRNEELKLLEKAIRGLPQNQEELIRFWMDGEEFCDMADKLGISLGAMYKRFERAMTRLGNDKAANVEPEVGFPPPAIAGAISAKYKQATRPPLKNDSLDFQREFPEWLQPEKWRV